MSMYVAHRYLMFMYVFTYADFGGNVMHSFRAQSDKNHIT